MRWEHPDRPLTGVGGIVVRNDGCVRKVQRGSDPWKGLGRLPGGVVELGETLSEAQQRELRKQCDITIEPG